MKNLVNCSLVLLFSVGLFKVAMSQKKYESDLNQFSITLNRTYVHSVQDLSEGQMDVFSFFDQDDKPVYMLYVNRSTISSSEINENVIYDEAFRKRLLQGIDCRILEEKIEKHQNFTCVRFNITLQSSKLAYGCIVAFTRDVSIYKIFYLAPSEESYHKFISEFDLSLESFMPN